MAKEVGSGENYTGHRIAKEVVPKGERGSDKEHVFNERTMGFDCCTFRSGLELSFVLLSCIVTTRLVCPSPVSWMVCAYAKKSIRISP